MLFDAHVHVHVHVHGLRVFGGVPGRGNYDNMKAAVDRVGRGKERQAAEKVSLMPLPPAFDGFVEHSKRVSPT